MVSLPQKILKDNKRYLINLGNVYNTFPCKNKQQTETLKNAYLLPYKWDNVDHHKCEEGSIGEDCGEVEDFVKTEDV